MEKGSAALRAEHAQDNIVGMIHFHVEVDGVPLTCISPWSHLAEHMYRVKNENFFINITFRLAFGLARATMPLCCWSELQQRMILHASPRPCRRTRAVLHVCVHIKPPSQVLLTSAAARCLGIQGFGADRVKALRSTCMQCVYAYMMLISASIFRVNMYGSGLCIGGIKVYFDVYIMVANMDKFERIPDYNGAGDVLYDGLGFRDSSYF